MKIHVLLTTIFLSNIIIAQTSSKLIGEWISVGYSAGSQYFSSTDHMTNDPDSTVKLVFDSIIVNRQSRFFSSIDTTIHYYELNRPESDDSLNFYTLKLHSKRKFKRKVDESWVVSVLTNDQLVLMRGLWAKDLNRAYYETIYFVRSNSIKFIEQKFNGKWFVQVYGNEAEKNVFEADTLTLFQCSSECECQSYANTAEVKRYFNFKSSLTDTVNSLVTSVEFVPTQLGSGVLSGVYVPVAQDLKLGFAVNKNDRIRIVKQGEVFYYRYEFKQNAGVIKLVRQK